MRPLKAAFLSIALIATSLGAAAPAMAVPASLDTAQVTKLATDIQTAIRNLLIANPNATVTQIEAAIRGAITADGYSNAVAAAALQVAQQSQTPGSDPSVAIASLWSEESGQNIPGGGGGGGGGGAPIGGLNTAGGGGAGPVT